LTGLTNVSGPISAGYFSRGQAVEASPNYDGTHALYGWCPRGYFCEEGTSEPVPCPAGTYGYLV